MVKEYRSIARIQKTHGRNGEVVAVPTHGLPLLLQEGLEVAIVPPALRGSRYHVVQRATDGDAGQLVQFGGCHTLAGASELVGKTVLARVSDLPADLVLHDADALCGRIVRDKRLGVLGVIDGLMRGPANDVWIVSGAYGEVLVPVVDSMIRCVPTQGDIEVEIPRGLVPDDAKEES
ncbi:MAG: 16S rRNA processing protein RimM [Coriobacteriales bacterium]|nr:16S rRNA processing protein RimM [Coriobacteriales bacterium]